MEGETARVRGFFVRASLLRPLRWSWEAVAATVAPADCQACGGPLLETSAAGVCTVCLDDLCPAMGALCVRCGELLAAEDVRGGGFSSDGAGLCEACFAEPPGFVQATAFAAYDGTLRTLIRLHKFEGAERLARPLGARLAAVLERAARMAGAETSAVRVVAVPLFARRRAFNQSAQLADEALRLLRKQAPALLLNAAHGALVRVRPTESQSHLTPAQRRENVRGAFAVQDDVTGWKVLLVDDVYTTGATVRECTRMLLRAGANEVRVVTLARTQRDAVQMWSDVAGWK